MKKSEDYFLSYNHNIERNPAVVKEAASFFRQKIFTKKNVTEPSTTTPDD